MITMFTWSTIWSFQFASHHLERQGLGLNINVSSMLQMPCKILSILYSVSFNTGRHISLLQFFPLLFVRGEKKSFFPLYFARGAAR